MKDKNRFYYNKDFLGSPDGRPIRILAEYFGPISKELYKSYEQHDQTTLETLYEIERNGLKTYEKIIYSEYNPFTFEIPLFSQFVSSSLTFCFLSLS